MAKGYVGQVCVNLRLLLMPEQLRGFWRRSIMGGLSLNECVVGAARTANDGLS